jgi:hypothetical protein
LLILNIRWIAHFSRVIVKKLKRFGLGLVYLKTPFGINQSMNGYDASAHYSYLVTVTHAVTHAKV